MTLPGYPLPFGATLDKNGAQFSIFSRNATSVTLLLFGGTTSQEHEDVFLDPAINKTGDIWHIWIEGIREGQLYAYKIDGPYEPSQGYRFNRNKLLLDPYARAVTGNFQWDLSDARGFDPASTDKDLSFSAKDSSPGAPKCIVINPGFDWYDRQIKTPMQNTIIYELHVKGFTHHPSSAVRNPGTFKGLVEKIPYLHDLGVTAVELMPIQEFDEDENTNINPVSGARLKNYWGYSTISFFAPKGRYSASGSMGEQYTEFKEMVRDFHRAGMEVILDIVFNHTAEGDHLGPTMCFRGIDNSIYYMLEENKRFYKNFSGCGNTFNCNHPLVRDFILDCLKFWVVEMHVDGFRFDLASILGRDQNGVMLSNPPLLETISEDPILRNAKIIAEAWDAGGAYQVGDFPGRWAEWNGKFRDDLRKFWRGDKAASGTMATRLTGSSDLYYDKGGPHHGINFITCHDGFTMNDLVCFNEKHNIENGENNADGENHNHSCNFGIEGLAATPYIESLRIRQIKNFLVSLFVSQGVPMLLAGDEFRRTQRGNNNAYCQDNDISWIDWNFADANREIFRFCKNIIWFRKKHVILRRRTFFTGAVSAGYSRPDIEWHGVHPYQPNWSDDNHIIACLINGEYAKMENGAVDNDIYIILNASQCNHNFEIPPAPSEKPWHVTIDTSLHPPDDIRIEGEETPLAGSRYYVKNLSSVILIAK